MENATYSVELTDTFGGEANYSWVRRATFTAPANATTRQLVRRAKREIGLSGRHHTSDYGDEIIIRPIGDCLIAFIRYQEPRA